MNLGVLVKERAEQFGDKTAFQIKKSGIYRKWSYKLVKNNVIALATRLKELGINKGDRVVILSENRPEWPIAYLAVTLISAIAVPIDIMLNPSEIEPLLKDSEAKAIITSFRAREEKGEGLLPIDIWMEEFVDFKLPSSDEVLKHEIDEDDVAALLYTSGTTGSSKGVMLTHKNIISNVLSIVQVAGVDRRDNFLSVLPLHHTFECTVGFLAPFYVGATITYAETLKAHNLMANMQETGTTVMLGVPLLYSLFYDGILREVESKGIILKIIFSLLIKIAELVPSQHFKRKLFPMIHKKLGGKIRFWVSGGAPIDLEVIKGFETFGITIIQGYGLTESAPILTANTLRVNKPGSIGKPVPGVVIKISDEGEILAKGPNIMKGYYKRPDLTDQVLQNGWLYTGDIGHIDGEGFLYITGRRKDVIVTGSGVNVYPDEIEFQLAKIKGVKSACVIGGRVAEGARKGSEDVWAIIQPDFEYFEKEKIHSKDEIEDSINKRISVLNEGLAEYKRISKVYLRDADFPKTTTKKVKKHLLKREMQLL